MAFNIEFNLSTIGTVPDEFIYGIAYDTQSYGNPPMGTAGPYNSLNVGLIDTPTYSGQPTVGTDVESDAVFWNTSQRPFYTDLGAGGTGTFRRDTGLEPVHSGGRVHCVGQWLLVHPGRYHTRPSERLPDRPDDPGPRRLHARRRGYTITAVDPVGGHFLGAVVANAGVSA